MRYIEYSYVNVNDGIQHSSHEYFKDVPEFDERKSLEELEDEGLQLVINYLTKDRIGRIFSKTDNPEELDIVITKDSYIDLYNFKRKIIEKEMRLYGSTRHDDWMDTEFQSFRSDD